jgi:hypothetical protein
MKKYIGIDGNENILHILDDYSKNYKIDLDINSNLIFTNIRTGEQIYVENYDLVFFKKDIDKSNDIKNGIKKIKELKIDLTNFYSQSGLLAIPDVFNNNANGYSIFNFPESFSTTPLVFSIANDRGSNACRVNIKSIEKNFIILNIIEPPSFDGPHIAQETSFFSILPGIHNLGNITFECGYIYTKKVVGDYANTNNEFGCEIINLKNNFENLGVILMPQTKNNEKNNIPYKPANPWFSVACEIIDNNSFKISIDLGETNGLIELPEKIAYVAFSTNKQSSFIDSYGNEILIETFKLDNVKGWDDGWFNYSLKNSYSKKPSIIVASLNSRNDSRGGWVRYKSIYNNSTISFTIDCDTAKRNNRNHKEETIAGIVISSPYFKKIK